MLIKTLKTLCAVYGWEVVNNHVRSGRSMDNPVTQASLSAERFDLRQPCPTQSRELLTQQMKKPFTNIIPNQPIILIISNSPKDFAFSKSKTSRASQIGRL